jgi:hypothetical protein
VALQSILSGKEINEGEMITDRRKPKYMKKNLLHCRFFTTNSTLTAVIIKLMLLGEDPPTNLVQGTTKSDVSEFSEHS